MSKLFVAVIPESECERNVEKLLNTFSNLPHEVKKLPDERDADYYMLDCGQYDGLAEILCSNLNDGSYSSLGKAIRFSDISRSVYGLYRAEALPETYVLDDFIEKGGSTKWQINQLQKF